MKRTHTQWKGYANINLLNSYIISLSSFCVFFVSFIFILNSIIWKWVEWRRVFSIEKQYSKLQRWLCVAIFLFYSLELNSLSQKNEEKKQNWIYFCVVLSVALADGKWQKARNMFTFNRQINLYNAITNSY